MTDPRHQHHFNFGPNPSESPRPIEDPLDVARELVTLALLDDEESERLLDERIGSLTYGTPNGWLVRGLIEALVIGLAATWDNADDFSAHVLAALTEPDGESA